MFERSRTSHGSVLLARLMKAQAPAETKKKLVSVKAVSYNVLLACRLAKKESENSCFSLCVADTTTVSPIL